jgi:hypothetical protein
MIVLAVICVFIFTIIACAGLVCAHYDADDLRNMGIQL